MTKEEKKIYKNTIKSLKHGINANVFDTKVMKFKANALQRKIERYKQTRRARELAEDNLNATYELYNELAEAEGY